MSFPPVQLGNTLVGANWTPFTALDYPHNGYWQKSVLVVPDADIELDHVFFYANSTSTAWFAYAQIYEGNTKLAHGYALPGSYGAGARWRQLDFPFPGDIKPVLLRARPYRIVVRPTSYFTHLGHEDIAYGNGAGSCEGYNGEPTYWWSYGIIFPDVMTFNLEGRYSIYAEGRKIAGIGKSYALSLAGVI